MLRRSFALPSSVVPALLLARRARSSCAVTPEKPFVSRRRHSAANTRGRAHQAEEHVRALKVMDAAQREAFFRQLPPRDKLDLLRRLHARGTARRRHRRASTSGLPRYPSAEFERRFYFREEDVEEQSTLGRGPGGQATNRRMQTCILVHRPTGLVVKHSRFPSLWLNRRAARELLSLRLEEHLAGDRSLLGRRRRARERRAARRAGQVARLARRGDRLRRREAAAPDYYGFLTGAAPLPASAVPPACASAPREVRLRDLLGDECRNLWTWWLDGAGPTECFLRCFPAAADGDGPERRSLERCAQSPEVREKVVCCLQCFCELFGLRLTEPRPGAPHIGRDGDNWRQLRHRMIAADGRVTAAARAAWQRVHDCLDGLGLHSHARAVRRFFERRAKSADGAETGWGFVPRRKGRESDKKES